MSQRKQYTNLQEKPVNTAPALNLGVRATTCLHQGCRMDLYHRFARQGAMIAGDFSTKKDHTRPAAA